MKTGNVRLIWLAVLPMMIFGCGSDRVDQRRDNNDLIVRSIGDDVVVLSDHGQVLSDTAWQTLTKEKLLSQSPLSFAVLADLTDTSRFQIGKYRFTIRWVKHYVGGLINRDLWHLDLKIEDTSMTPIKVLLYLHIAGWKDKDGFHLGILEETTGWCRIIVAKFEVIKSTILEAIKRFTAIPEKVAILIANTTAKIVLLIY